MSTHHAVEPEVVSVREVARAAGVPVAEVRSLLASADVRVARGSYVDFASAVGLVRTLAREREVGPERLFAWRSPAERHPGVPLAASGALHAGLLGAFVLIAGLSLHSEVTEQRIAEPARLVFVATPGPGGGGGGGGLRTPTPAPEARLAGKTTFRSPVALRRSETPAPKPPRVETPPAAVPEPRPEPPPPAPPAPAPPVVAPVVSAPADTTDRAGVVTPSTADKAANGSGTDGGTGTGRGTGTGEGDGAGIGAGSTAGAGGGPYRPGSGIAAPSLVREVKPIYSEEGRRRNIEGDVVMEVVVRSDGSVGAVRIVHGLGSGLDERAAEAVRQWRFTPARRYGTPVDVLVEVAVEFRLR